ncbi:MAG: hypothetical protein H7A46_22955 [Verrucomicrobiales bacterium]|nr:hypothetical protein [Verrucomicrobiales bacterium]
MRLVVLLLPICLGMAGAFPAESAEPPAQRRTVFISGPEAGDLPRVLADNGLIVRRFDNPTDAVDVAVPGGAVLILAGDYPAETTDVPEQLLSLAEAKGLRLYLEYPRALPGRTLGSGRSPRWERVVVATDFFGPMLPANRILAMHDCHILPTEAANAPLVLARVAGFDTAVYGLPPETVPVLFEHDDHTLVATTCLSGFVTGRYAPVAAWGRVWTRIIEWLFPGQTVPELHWTPPVRPSYGRDEALPADAERQALRRGVAWYESARMLVHPSWKDTYDTTASGWPDRVGPAPSADQPCGDGSLGVLEGFSSQVGSDGAQPVRWWRRHDCNGEAAGGMALAARALDDPRWAARAGNVADYLYTRSILSQGHRANPAHPAFGLFGWNDVPRYHGDLDGYGVYYSSDNARGLLGVIAGAAALEVDRWDRRILEGLMANLRLAGTLGFQPNRIDEPELVRRGWRYFHEAGTVSLQPHYQAHMWACYLWAYRATGHRPLLDLAKSAIARTMAAYPDGWRWTNGIQQERAVMLLCLAWLVRLEDTPEHRDWVRSVGGDLLKGQVACGAIREELGPPGRGDYGPPASNAAYGTNEATLLHANGDPVCDLLYTSNFAFLALHEAAAATGETAYAEAGDRLAQFLCRIQVRSEVRKELDGAWFRAFDFDRWEHWASNADAGWGAWSVETGWTQGWIIAVLAMRQLDTSLWDLTAGSRLGRHLDEVRRVLGTE